MARIYVIGIGYRPLDRKALDALSRSTVILTSQRLFDVFQRYEQFDAVRKKIKVINNINETMEYMKSLCSDPKVKEFALLASGDPMFFGIGRRVIEEFGTASVEMMPDLSSIQLAFSRLKERWDNALLISVHGGPDPQKRRTLKYEVRDIPALLNDHPTIAVLTDRVNNPSVIAGELDPEIEMHVCEKLGYPEERIISGKAGKIAGMSFEDPNIVILRGREREVVPLGLGEDEIVHSRGLITKDEVRAITLHKLRFPRKGVFWDIGAGSGSVSVEASRLCPGLKVYAVEKNGEQIDNLRNNVRRFSVPDMEIIHGSAPGALNGLPSPDRVFIGGSGGRLKEIVENVCTRMTSGVIIINAVTLDTLNESFSSLEDNGCMTDVTEVSISRSKIIGDRKHMNALNPVFIVRGVRR